MEQDQTFQSDLKAKLTNNIELVSNNYNIGSEAPYQTMHTQQSTRTLDTQINQQQQQQQIQQNKNQNPFYSEKQQSKNIDISDDIEIVKKDSSSIMEKKNLKEQLIANYQEIMFEPDFTFFLFVNSTSGGNQAANFIKIQAERINFVLDMSKDGKETFQVEVFFYDLKNAQNKERGFTLLKNKQDSGRKNMRAIVGGGDGTVMWVIQEMLAKKCDLNNIPIGIVPFGTGNDFSRVLGWGGGVSDDFIGKNLKGLKEMVKKWIKAKVAPFDIWEIKFKAGEKGSFKRIEKENGKAVKKDLRDNNGEILKVMKKPMSNYFSIGIDARIGIGFDKNRTTSQIGNKCVYCWEGFKKIFIRTPKISQVVDALEELHEEDVSQDKISELDISIEDSFSNRQVVFNTRSASMALSASQAQQLRESQAKRIEDKKNNNILKGNPACLLVLNINSYAGGTNKIWGSSQGQVGLEKFNHNKVQDQFQKQDFGDGMVEFVSFTSAISLANERFISGQASRVAQGKGPFVLKFKKMSGEKNQTPIKSYFQIDGEYYQIDNPESVKIKQNKQVPNGKIQVLINTQGNSY